MDARAAKAPGGWRFTRVAGASDVGKPPRRSPCPICNGTDRCVWSAPVEVSPGFDAAGRPMRPVMVRAVLCRRAIEDKIGSSRHGSDEKSYQALAKYRGARVWAPVLQGKVVTPPAISAEELEQEQAFELEAAEARRELAEHWFLSVVCGGRYASDRGVNHPVIRAYLLSRGIDPAWLPGGVVPRALRYAEAFPTRFGYENDWWNRGLKHPLRDRDGRVLQGGVRDVAVSTYRDASGRDLQQVAESMVAAVVSGRPEVGGRFIRGVHQTCLVRHADGRVEKDRERFGGGGRRWHAACDGVVAFDGDGVTKERRFPGGIAVAGEGIENTLAGMVAIGQAVKAGKVSVDGLVGCPSAFACKSAAGMSQLATELEQSVRAREEITTVILLGELDKLLTSDGAVSRTSQRSLLKVQHELRARCPFLKHVVIVHVPADLYPELVEIVDLSDDEIQEHQRRISIESGRGEAIVGLGSGVIDSGGGVRLRELRARGWRDGDGGVDWNDAIRVREVGFEADVCVQMAGVAIMRPVLAAMEMPSMPVAVLGEARGNRALHSLESPLPPNPSEIDASAQGAHLSPSGDAIGGAGGDGGDDGGGEGGPPAAAYGTGEPDDDRDGLVIPKTDLGRAHAFLWQTMSPHPEHRPRSCYHLVHVDGEFKRWDGKVWVPMRSKGEVAAIRGLVRVWMTRRGERKEVEGEKRVVMLNPALKTVDAVSKCVLDEVRIDTDEPRFWITPHFDAAGDPVVGRPPWERSITRPDLAGLPRPRDLIGLENCLLDTAAWERGELITFDHTPRFFNEHVLPFELPIARVRQAIEAGDGPGLLGLAEGLCPNFIAFLDGVFEVDRSPEDGRQCIDELRKLIWYYCTYEISAKEANIALFFGPDNAGKGTLMDVIKAVVGEGNFVSSTVDEAADKNHVTSWQGKRLAVVSEAEGGERADMRRAMNFWKRVSGGDGVSLRELYKLEKPDVQLPTKILVSCNEPPDMKDRTGALLSRMILFPFKTSHTGAATYDPGLKRRVLEEKAGVFLWAMAGGLEVGERKRQGLKVFEQPRAGGGVMAGYRAFQGDLEKFIEDWLVVETDHEFQLLSRDMFEAYVEYRRLDNHPKPDSGGPAGLTKGITALLWKAGWRGEYLPSVQVTDGRSGEKRRMAAFTKLRLSDVAKNQMAAVVAKATTSYDQRDQSQIFPQ